jgi:AmiR/NasT family two-component response regulator
MNSRRCTQEQAFDLLRQVSQNSHRKLAAVAADVTLTGVLEGA